MRDGEKGLPEGEVSDSKRLAAAGMATSLLVIYRATKDVSLKEDLLPLIDMAYDYGSLAEGRKADRLAIVRGRMDSDIPAYLSWFKHNRLRQLGPRVAAETNAFDPSCPPQ